MENTATMFSNRECRYREMPNCQDYQTIRWQRVAFIFSSISCHQWTAMNASTGILLIQAPKLSKSRFQSIFKNFRYEFFNETLANREARNLIVQKNKSNIFSKKVDIT